MPKQTIKPTKQHSTPLEHPLRHSDRPTDADAPRRDRERKGGAASRCVEVAAAARGLGGPMGGSLVSMLRWPPDLGLPSLAALLPSPPAQLRVQEWWQWQWSRPEQLGAAARRWPELVRDVPLLVDAALWGVVTAVESVALVSMMCCFFLCCGCTL